MPRQIDHDARRLQILRDSLGLFARHGYAGLSMRALASGLGVSTGTLYHYFDGKEAIFAATVRHLADDVIGEAVAGIAPEADRAARLEALGRTLLARADELQQALSIAQEAARGGDPDQVGLTREVFAAFTGVIQRELALPDPAPARVLLSFLLGLLTHRHLDPDGVDLRLHVDVMVQLGGAWQA